jgi:hypothetical protein
MNTENKNSYLLKEEIMKELQEDGTKQLTQIKKDTKTNDEFINSLKDIVIKGDEQFKEKLGRSMTYSEMRQLYG